MSCLAKMQEFVDKYKLDIEEVCAWCKVATCIKGEFSVGFFPPFVYDIRNSVPFSNLCLEDEKLVYDLIPVILK